ncbi:hypothetical protein JNUCC1_02630 [Lentibacillus sp. JNUCC-1]|uniref:hypothetical protein n=1 Tax=Lentibacillus sp. JNUCC-1 TaxID=2654513 RepID=UPI0012E877BF|nr:hypothetical protein [Lentibacillus sp. JNUCC-1]MUV38759.1 hypothetical protein [Lentibacillus sp. JNUCC-1]
MKKMVIPIVVLVFMVMGLFGCTSDNDQLRNVGETGTHSKLKAVNLAEKQDIILPIEDKDLYDNADSVADVEMNDTETTSTDTDMEPDYLSNLSSSLNSVSTILSDLGENFSEANNDRSVIETNRWQTDVRFNATKIQLVAAALQGMDNEGLVPDEFIELNDLSVRAFMTMAEGAKIIADGAEEGNMDTFSTGQFVMVKGFDMFDEVEAEIDRLE